jgi:hypothetical protein
MFSRLFALASCAAAAAQLIPDWLVAPPSSWPMPAFTPNADGSWTLSNGLVSRTFIFSPAFGTVDFFSAARGASLLRAINNEGAIGLDGTTYTLGGIIQTGTYYHAYLNRSDLGIEIDPSGWNATSWSLSAPTAPFPWTPGTRGSPSDVAWPPAGLTLYVVLAAPASAPPAHRAVSVMLHYQLVVGVPLLTVWMSVNSTGAAAAGVGRGRSRRVARARAGRGHRLVAEQPVAGGASAAGAGVGGRLVAGCGVGLRGFNVLAAAAAGVGQALGEQLLQGTLVGGAALALPEHWGVAAQAAALELLQDRLVSPWHAARGVDVFDAHARPNAVGIAERREPRFLRNPRPCQHHDRTGHMPPNLAKRPCEATAIRRPQARAADHGRNMKSASCS